MRLATPDLPGARGRYLIPDSTGPGILGSNPNEPGYVVIAAPWNVGTWSMILLLTARVLAVLKASCIALVVERSPLAMPRRTIRGGCAGTAWLS